MVRLYFGILILVFGVKMQISDAFGICIVA